MEVRVGSVEMNVEFVTISGGERWVITISGGEVGLVTISGGEVGLVTISRDKH